MTERLIAFADREPGDAEVTIYDADAVPIEPAWLALSSDDNEHYVLYYLAVDGRVLALAQFDSTHDALVRARDTSGVPIERWNTCNVALHDGWTLLPRSLVASS
jgi:hypothetical protein